MSHVVSPMAEKLIDREFPLLNNGYIKLVDYLGNDERVIQAATMSYGSDAVDTHEKQVRLINDMVKKGHTSPFEQVVMTIIVKMPILAARQWVRHRTARMNEQSARYADVARKDLYVPSEENLKTRLNTTGLERVTDLMSQSGEHYEDVLNGVVSDFQTLIMNSNEVAFNMYEKLKEFGIVRELARDVLPVGMYTTFMWQIDFNNLMHFLDLREDEHAQYEIRVFAHALHDIARCIAPNTIDAFDEYIRDGARISKSEIAEIAALIPDTPENKKLKARFNSLVVRNAKREHMYDDPSMERITF